VDEVIYNREILCFCERRERVRTYRGSVLIPVQRLRVDTRECPHHGLLNARGHKIPIAALTGAHLAVKLSFSVVPWNERTREIFYSEGKAIRTERMNRCVIERNSNVTMDESVYRSKLMEV
jgi:hypothetical protein